MDGALYDDFGNYCGPDLSSSDESEDGGDDGEPAAAAEQGGGGDGAVAMEGADPDAELTRLDELKVADGSEIVLFEDKQYYPDAEEVYGAGTETMVQEEDTQPLEQPIVAPVKVLKHELLETELPHLTFSREFAVGLMDAPALVRNVAFIGHLHHGKTSFMDLLVSQTHTAISSNGLAGWDLEKSVRYTDYRRDEQDRGLTVKSTPISLVMPTSRDKSYLLNTIDTPGHVNFTDEASAAMRLADGVVVVIDVLEGVMLNTERLIRQAVNGRLKLVLVINKIDRLILELKLPPNDAYFKIRAVLADANAVVASCPGNDGVAFAPELGNVVFASAANGWSFSLAQFARIYAECHDVEMDTLQFSKRLWGDWFFDPSTRTFARKRISGSERTFVEFVLTPLYKLYSQVLGEETAELQATLSGLGIRLKRAELQLNVNPLLKLVTSRFFGDATGFVDMIVKHIPSPKEAAATKVESSYSGEQDSALAMAMRRCDAKGPLMINVTKLYAKPDGSGFDALGRVLSGTARPGMKVRVLGEGYSLDDDEDMVEAEITNVGLFQGGRYRLDLSRVAAGSWVLLEGVDGSILKTATICDAGADARTFRRLQFDTLPYFKVAVEPLNPSELPKMLEGLRKINKSYPLAVTKVEESGEHVVLGTGELYMDCALHDLRKIFSDIEIKVADPVVTFCETVVETSSLKCFAETPNKRNKLTMIAEPLEPGLAADIEAHEVCSSWPRRKLGAWMKEKYDWDLLAGRSIWAFGPSADGPNILIDDTLPTEVDKAQLGQIRDYIVQGFQWGTREGPLCDEPIRSTKFKLTDAGIAEEPIHRGGGQVIPTARRIIYSAFMTATPRLMEPILFCEITAPADSVNAIYDVLSRRRGHVTVEKALPGTPLQRVSAYLPGIESFGFETDLRSHTQGAAFCISVFDSWAVVPGDPLDTTIVLRPLEAAPANSLAREFVVKTRRRKGLGEHLDAAQYHDEGLLQLIEEDSLGGE